MPGGIRGPIDWVGYSTGQLQVPAAGGLRGALDFLGYRVGATSGAIVTVILVDEDDV